jgi:hypothetical protein
VKGVVLALVGVLVLGNTDNVVRPLMLSGTARMSTLVLIISILGGVSAFGFIGIVLGPVVGAVFTALVETYAMLPDDPAVQEAPDTVPEAPPGSPANVVGSATVPSTPTSVAPKASSQPPAPHV